MKISYTLILLSFFSFQLVLGQTEEERKEIIKDYDLQKLDSLTEQFKIEFSKNYALALRLAKKNNWEIIIEREDGSVSELAGVNEDGSPIYHTTFNEKTAVTGRVNSLYPAGSLGLNLTGTNMILGVWDSRKPLVTHDLFNGRVVVKDNSSSGASDFHSTHVIGTAIGGDGVKEKARGMAYNAKVYSYNSINDIAEVNTEASQGLLVSNHSYGNIELEDVSEYYRGKYDAKARSYDLIMNNAPNYLAVFAAGNYRNDGLSATGYDLLGGIGCSKNGLTVGAVNEVANYTGTNSVIMSDFSSWGPTDDGRIKPDISTQGVGVFSSTDASNSSYTTFNGTSMSAPSVAGALLLLQQHYNNVNGVYMRSSTLRGLICHTADEAGRNEGPDYEFGWGLMNAERAANVITEGESNRIDEITLEQGETYSIDVTASDIEDLIASITWTDEKGTVLTTTDLNDRSPMLVNDLDIKISQGSTIFYPWKLDPNNPSNGAVKGDNTVDNIEKIQVVNPSGVYTIEVSHKGTLDEPQVFSLIISGINNIFANTPKKNDLSLINIYPNPTSDNLTLSFNNDKGSESYNITVYSIDGRVIQEMRKDKLSDEVILNFDDQKSGVYLLRCESQSVNFTEKIIIRD